MFALTDVDIFKSFNAKCKPEDCIELRERYSGIKPGYHMSKKHWNTIFTDGSVPDELMYELISNSYDLVVAGLTKKAREALKKLWILNFEFWILRGGAITQMINLLIQVF